MLALLLLFALPLTALADGRFYAPTAIAANVTIPDQRALIHFTNGTERLVIETRFTGSGTNFAWVVPLPTQPVIEEASTGLFPTLQDLFRPQLLHNVPRYYLWLLGLVGISYLLLFVRPTGSVSALDFCVCLLVGGGIGSSIPMPALPVLGFLVFLNLICWVILVRFSGAFALSSFTRFLLALFAIALTAFLLLPALSTAKSRSAGSTTTTADQDVSILDRQFVGIFETTTVASGSPKALQNWLRDNGFALPATSKSVIESYAKDGWVFVAAKVRRDTSPRATSTPHPLSFTFKTAKPVYPMRLTGVDNGRLQVELYVFGPARAKAPHFKVGRCTQPGYPDPPGSWGFWAPETPNIVHPLLRKWVAGSPVATKLTASLTAAEMREDVWLDWLPFSEKTTRFYSRSGAGITAVNWGTGAILAGMWSAFWLFAIAWDSANRQRRTARLAVGLTTFSLVLASTLYVALPKQMSNCQAHPAARAYNALYYPTLSCWTRPTYRWPRPEPCWPRSPKLTASSAGRAIPTASPGRTICRAATFTRKILPAITPCEKPTAGWIPHL